MATVLERLGRFNAGHPWSHNAAYTPVVLRHAVAVRLRGGRSALDVGCGAGLLARSLGRVFRTVVAVEPDAATAELARRRTADRPSVRVLTGTADAVGSECFDLVTAVAVLHHMPLRVGLRALRDRVRPGGRLVVVGLAAGGQGDLPWDLLSMLLNPVVGFLRHPGGAVEPEHMTAPTAPAQETFAEIVAAAREVLPGVRVRRGLFWRYVLVWRA